MQKIMAFFNKKGQDKKSSVRCEVAEAISEAMGLTNSVMNNAKSLQEQLKQLEKIRIKKCSLHHS